MGMAAVLSRAACFVAIIILGQVLRRVHFFQPEDFKVFSKIVLKITLPAAIVYSFSDKEITLSLLPIALLGLGGGILYIVAAMVINVRSSKEQRGFEMLNMAGYNIGNFTLPFVQSFLGPVGVVTSSLFDTGNAVICLGGAFSAASMAKGVGGNFSVKKIVRTLVTSVPFDAYVVMVTLSLLHLRLPQGVISFAEIISNANAAMAMLMLGVGFNLSGNKEQIREIVKMLSVRYGIAVMLALGFYFLLPYDLEYRQTLAVMAFAPLSSAAPAFTVDLKGDTGLASAVNSISIVISIICIITVLSLIL